MNEKKKSGMQIASKEVSNVLSLYCNILIMEWQLPGKTFLKENQVWCEFYIPFPKDNSLLINKHNAKCISYHRLISFALTLSPGDYFPLF